MFKAIQFAGWHWHHFISFPRIVDLLNCPKVLVFLGSSPWDRRVTELLRWNDVDWKEMKRGFQYDECNRQGVYISKFYQILIDLACLDFHSPEGCSNILYIYYNIWLQDINIVIVWEDINCSVGVLWRVFVNVFLNLQIGYDRLGNYFWPWRNGVGSSDRPNPNCAPRWPKQSAWPAWCILYMYVSPQRLAKTIQSKVFHSHTSGAATVRRKASRLCLSEAWKGGIGKTWGFFIISWNIRGLYLNLKKIRN